MNGKDGKEPEAVFIDELLKTAGNPGRIFTEDPGRKNVQTERKGRDPYYQLGHGQAADHSDNGRIWRT